MKESRLSPLFVPLQSGGMEVKMGRDIRIVKFKMFIKEMWKILNDEPLAGEVKDVVDGNASLAGRRFRNPRKEGIWLALIFDYNELNDYGKIIMEVVGGVDTEYMDEEIELLEKYVDEEYRINEAEKFIEGFNKVKYGYRAESLKRAFIFWALMILTVDDTDKEKHLSLICDYVRMLGLTDEDLEDMVQIIRVIYHKIEGECRLNNSFENRNDGIRKAYFRGLLAKYVYSSVKITDKNGKEWEKSIFGLWR